MRTCHPSWARFGVTGVMGLVALGLGGIAQAGFWDGDPLNLKYRADTRPDAPKLLMFSAMTPQYLRDHAAEWGARGLNGCM